MQKQTERGHVVRLPGRGDGLALARTHAAEYAGRGSIWWAPVQGGRTAGRSRASSASCKLGGTLQGKHTTEVGPTLAAVKDLFNKFLYNYSSVLYCISILINILSSGLWGGQIENPSCSLGLQYSNINLIKTILWIRHCHADMYLKMNRFIVGIGYKPDILFLWSRRQPQTNKQTLCYGLNSISHFL